MKKQKQPTCTSLVEQALRNADDFLKAPQIQQITGCSSNQVSAALHNLHKFKVVDFVSSEEALWWFALSPENDTRTFKVEERTPEVKPRRPRKSKKADKSQNG